MPQIWKLHDAIYTIYYSCNNSSRNIKWVGIIIAPHIKQIIKSVIFLSDRIILLQLRTTPVDMNIIQIYAPTADMDETVIRKFYEQLESLIKMTKKGKISHIMGDFNAKMGNKITEATVSFSFAKNSTCY